jgi:DNA-binding response OmpR family regulator
MEVIRILIIDDEAPILATLSSVFEMEPDFEVLTLSDVLQWRETVAQFHPNIVLVDYRMPAMNGNLLIQALNASGMRAHIQVVGLISATPFTDAEVQRFGADTFFEKPFTIEHLVSTLRKLHAQRSQGTGIQLRVV